VILCIEAVVAYRILLEAQERRKILGDEMLEVSTKVAFCYWETPPGPKEKSSHDLTNDGFKASAQYFHSENLEESLLLEDFFYKLGRS